MGSAGCRVRLRVHSERKHAVRDGGSRRGVTLGGRPPSRIRQNVNIPVVSAGSGGEGLGWESMGDKDEQKRALADMLQEDSKKLFRDEGFDVDELVEETDEALRQREIDLRELTQSCSSEELVEMTDEDITRWAHASRRGRWDAHSQHFMNHIKKIVRMEIVFCRHKYILVPYIASRAQMLDEALEARNPTVEHFFDLFPIKNKEFIAILQVWEDYIRWEYELMETGELKNDNMDRRKLTSLTMDSLDSALTLDADSMNTWNSVLNGSADWGHYERTELFGERLRIKRVAETLGFQRKDAVKLYGKGLTDTTLFEYHPGSDAIFRRLARGFEWDALGGWHGGRLDIHHFS